MNDYLRDRSGKILGRLITEGNGDVRLHRANGTVAGKWIKHSDFVFNERLQVVGRGIALLATLLER